MRTHFPIRNRAKQAYIQARNALENPEREATTYLKAKKREKMPFANHGEGLHE